MICEIVSLRSKDIDHDYASHDYPRNAEKRTGVA